MHYEPSLNCTAFVFAAWRIWLFVVSYSGTSSLTFRCLNCDCDLQRIQTCEKIQQIVKHIWYRRYQYTIRTAKGSSSVQKVYRKKLRIAQNYQFIQYIHKNIFLHFVIPLIFKCLIIIMGIALSYLINIFIVCKQIQLFFDILFL